MGYEARNWSRLAPRKAERALSTIVSSFGSDLAHVSKAAESAAGRSDLAASLREGKLLGTFAELSRIASGLRRQGIADGLAVRAADGSVLAWAGDLPNYFEEAGGWPPEHKVDVRSSTAYFWIEGHAPMAAGGSEAAAWVSVFKAIDARYPGVLPGELVRTLAGEFTRRVRHQVTVTLGAQRAGDEAAGASGLAAAPMQVSADLAASDGRRLGEVAVLERSSGDEQDLLRGRGLFAAAIVVLALLALGGVVAGRRLVGPRFSKASPRNLLLVFAVVWGARFALVPLRDLLHLGGLRVFTSYDYATQIPGGILRSPADLALTWLAAALCVVCATVARMRFARPSARRGGPGGRVRPLHLVAGSVAGILSVSVVVLADRSMRAVLADSSVNLFVLSPFAASAAAIVMKAAVFLLAATFLLVGSGLIAWQISWFERSFARADTRGARAPWRAIAVSALVVFGLTAGAAGLGLGPVIFVAAALCFGGGLVARAIFEWKRAGSLVGLVVGLALAAALLQLPYALGDFYAKERESAESAAARIAARTDEWKMSMLDEALGGIAQDHEILAALRGRDGPAAGRLDSEALRLWAGSILSSARVACGVHILDRAGEEIGRFSLEDVGDLAEIESSIRLARFGPGVTTFVARGTFGGKDTDLYVGVAPLAEGGVYLGSVVVSIPYFYSDLESWVGLRPSFLEAIGGTVGQGPQFGEGYSASLIANGKVVGTTAKDLEVGSEAGDEIKQLALAASRSPQWIQARTGGAVHAFYPVSLSRPGEALILSYRLMSPSESAVYFMSVILANMVVALGIILVGGVVRAGRHLARRLRGASPARFKWSFATKLSLAFLVIAILPTLILGATSREFLRARLREVMESKAEESLNLSRLALRRLVEGEAVRLARNPILLDELRAEPSILGVLVSNDVAAAVADSSGRTLAAFGNAVIPGRILASVLSEGRSYNLFAADGGLTAKSAVPIRDIVFPDQIAGCAFVSRSMNEDLARRISLDLNRDIIFYGQDRLAASSKQELFTSEVMPTSISPDAYTDCFLRGREIHFTWQRIGKVDVVIGYSPLRGYDGRPVGAISVPLVFRKDEVSQRMEWTSTAISYLVAIVIGSIFALGLVLARRISNPIRDLIRGTQRVSSGDMGFTIPKASDDEIGELVSSFNRMTVALDRSRSALNERKRYIETIISNVGAGIISTDGRGRIDTINAAAETMLGVRARNAGGKDAGGLLRKIGAGGLAGILDDVRGGESMARGEVARTDSSGATVTLRAVATRVMGPRDRAMGKVIVFEDVTELIRSKKLVAWSEMARQVAHEIKNPLTPMKLSAQQILQAYRDGAEDFDKILVESLATIVSEIESLRRIAVEFSQFSRMPERKLERVGISDVIEESLAQYGQTVGGLVEIVKYLDPTNPRVVVDRDEVKRVFLNVIENAIQAMPDGGRLEVRSERAGGARQHAWGGTARGGSVRGGAARKGSEPVPEGASLQPVARPNGRRYEVGVSSRPAYAERLGAFTEVAFIDTGIGISKENSAKLFEPNFSTKTHGTGLGLAISKGIMDAYGGELAIESTEGVGTCVSVRFPADEPATTRPRPPRRRGSRGRHRPRRG
jgi:PAS domain S-box-containing protein